MKNIHIIPTDKPSRLFKANQKLCFDNVNPSTKCITAQNIYITCDEEIKAGDYFIESLGLPDSYLVHKLSKEWKDKESFYRRCDKVILTTDSDLIKDGVQAIDDEFLEWFVKDPSCENVEVMTDAFTVKEMSMLPIGTGNFKYKIIIPKEELKQETLEEAIKREYEVRKFNGDFPFDPQSFKLGAKWAEKQMEKLKDFETWKEWKNG